MALAFDSARWEALARRADARGRGRRDRLGARAARPAGRHLVRGRFPRPGDVPARAGGGAAAGVRRSRRVDRVPVRADARPRRHAGRHRRPSRAVCRAAGPADDELMITSGGIEALELIGKSFLDPGDVVVVEAPTYLGSIQSFRSFEAELVPVTARRATASTSTSWSSGSPTASGRSSSTRSRTTRTRPASVSPADRRAALVELARRYGFLVVEDVAYRELGFDGDAAAEPVEPRPRRRRPDRDDVEDAVPRRAPRLGGRAGRRRRAGSSRRSRSPTSAPRRSGSGSSRSRSAAAGSTSSSCARGRSTGASASGCWRRSSARCRSRRGGRRRAAASSPG